MGVGGGAEGKLLGCWRAELGTSVSSPDDSSSSSSQDSATSPVFFFFLDAWGDEGWGFMDSLFSVVSSSAGGQEGQ